MIENKRFRKVMGFIQDTTCEGGDVERVMDLTEIEDMLNSLNDEKLKNECMLKRKSRKITDLANFNVELMEENKQLKADNEQLKKEISRWKYGYGGGIVVNYND